MRRAYDLSLLPHDQTKKLSNNNSMSKIDMEFIHIHSSYGNFNIILVSNIQHKII